MSGSATTKNIDTTPDEKIRQLQRKLNESGYTDKFGQPLKEDGIYGGKTAYADDNMKADNPSQRVGNKANLPSRGPSANTNNTIKNDNAKPFSKDDLTFDEYMKIGKYVYGDDFNPYIFSVNITDDGMVMVPQKTASLSGPMVASIPVGDILKKVKTTTQKVVNMVGKTYETLTSKVTWESLLSASEQGVGMLDLKNGYSLSKKADERAIKYAEENNIDKDENGEIITWGNKTDAYRHFTWNYEMASNLGYSTALKISSAHEIAFLRVHNLVKYANTGNLHDRKAFMTPLMLMDVWNNLKSVNSFSEFKDKGYNYEKAFDIMVERNALVYNGDQALKAFGFGETDITTEKVGEEFLEGIWVYFNYKNGYITNVRKSD